MRVVFHGHMHPGAWVKRRRRSILPDVAIWLACIMVVAAVAYKFMGPSWG